MGGKLAWKLLKLPNLIVYLGGDNLGGLRCGVFPLVFLDIFLPTPYIKHNIHPLPLPRKRINVAHTIFKLHIWCALQLMWPTTIRYDE